MKRFTQFLSEILKEKYDAETFARGTINEATDDFFEVRGMYTKSGIPVTSRF